MAYTQGFLQLRALTTPVRVWPQREVGSTKRNHIVCMAQKEDGQEGDATTLSHVSRRLALSTALIGGAAAAATKVSPAEAADAQLSLAEPGILPFITSLSNHIFACLFLCVSFIKSLSNAYLVCPVKLQNLSN